MLRLRISLIYLLIQGLGLLYDFFLNLRGHRPNTYDRINLKSGRKYNFKPQNHLSLENNIHSVMNI